MATIKKKVISHLKEDKREARMGIRKDEKLEKSLKKKAKKK